MVLGGGGLGGDWVSMQPRGQAQQDQCPCKKRHQRVGALSPALPHEDTARRRCVQASKRALTRTSEQASQPPTSSGLPKQEITVCGLRPQAFVTAARADRDNANADTALIYYVNGF